MIRRLSIAFLLISLTLMPAAASDLEWQRLPVFTDKTLQIVHACNPDSLWLVDNDRRLLLWRNDEIMVIQPPELATGEQLHYSAINHQIIASLTKVTGETLFYSLEPEGLSWAPIPGSVKVPVRYLAAIDAKNWIAAGDWGRVLLFSKRTRFNVQNPLSTHVLSLALTGPDSIWLGTRNDGLYRMDRDQHFSHHAHPALKGQDIIAILPRPSGGPRLVTDAGWIYQLDDSLVVRCSTRTQMNLLRAVESTDDRILGLSQSGKLYWHHEGWETVTLPTHYQIRSLELGADGRPYLAGLQGMVLFESHDAPLQFFNYADHASIETSSSSRSHGGIFRDFNGDALPDLLVRNIGINQLSRLYINHGDFHFSDQSGLGGLFDLPNLQQVLSADLDRDGNQDLILIDIDHEHYRVTTSYQLGLSRLWQRERVQLLEPDDRRLTDLTVWDLDEDGDTDALISYRYDPAHHPGAVFWLKNQCGHLQNSDSLFTAEESGWWMDAVPLAFKRNGERLLYLANRWGQDRILTVGEPSSIQDCYSELMPDEWDVQTISVLVADLNNDGNQDLLRISLDAGLEIFLWTGERFALRNGELFQDSRSETGAGLAREVTLGDFDQNGYLDLFVAPRLPVGERNWLYLNREGKRFEEVARQAGVDLPVVRGTTCADVDQDGDLDLYGFRDGPNLLWVSNTHQADVLAIQVKGTQSNPDGLGAELWFYPAGRLDQSDELWAYRRVDISNHSSVGQNTAWLHIGLDTIKAVDCRVRFLNGREGVYHDLQAGSRVVIGDRQGPMRALFRFPWVALRHLRNGGLQLNLLAFAFLLTIVFSVVPRLQTFRKGPPGLTLSAVIGVVTLFWVLSYVFRNQGVLGVFILPLGVPLLMASIPLVAIWIYQHFVVVVPINLLFETLLEKVMVFSHGAWAQRNLQGVLLHLEHLAAGGQEDEEVRERLIERLRTLVDLTLPAMSDVLRTAQRCGLGGSDLANALNRMSVTQDNAQRLLLGQKLSPMDLRHLSQQIRDLQAHTRQVRHQTVARFTVDLGQVIRQVKESLAIDLQTRDIQVDLVLPEKPCWGLVKTADLAAILDNAIHNSIRAMEQKDRKRIEIRLLPERLHQVIEIQDSGCGIPADQWESIFQAGDSGSKSTGMGLFHSRESLKTVSGSIRVTASSPLTGTTMTIRLQKGRHDESSAHSDH